MFSINQPLFLQKTKPLYPKPKYLFGIGIRDDFNPLYIVEEGGSHDDANSFKMHFAVLSKGHP
jgi:hypothetical protein